MDTLYPYRIAYISEIRRKYDEEMAKKQAAFDPSKGLYHDPRQGMDTNTYYRLKRHFERAK